MEFSGSAQYLRFIYKKIYDLTLDLDFWVQVTQNFSKDHLDEVIYAPAKFEVAMSNGLGGDAITINMTDSQAHTDDGPKLMATFFLK